MTSTAARLRGSFALAVLLHGGLVPMLPDLRQRLEAMSQAIPVPIDLAPSGPPVIPVKLPGSGNGFELQTELGAIARRSPRDDRPMPGVPAGAVPRRLAMSGGLGAAAREAAAAERGQAIAELGLASGPGPTAQAVAAGDERPIARTATPPPSPAPADSKPAGNGGGGKAAADSKRPGRPPPPAPPPIQRLDPSIEPEPHAADAPPLAAGSGLTLDSAAPERGPGEFSSSRSAFFSRLTEHLLKVNQQVLAEAVRASPRLVVEVRFTVDRRGRVLSAEPVRGTGSAELDEKAVRVIQRASPLPSLAADMPQAQLELSFPVQIYR
jgi:TonB family protein